MSDVYGRIDTVHRGGITGDSLFVDWASNGVDQGEAVLGLLVQVFGLQYAQAARRIFELGPGVSQPDGSRKQTSYYIVSRPEGQFSLSRIAGPSALQCSFYSTLGNACLNNSMVVAGATGCVSGSTNNFSSGTAMEWLMDGVLLNNIAANITAQEGIMQESQTGQFVSLKLNIAGSFGVC